MTRMKRKALLMVVLFLLWSGAFPLFSQSTGVSSSPIPEAYTKEEFPQWLQDLRRFEVIAFGSIPFTIFFATTGIDSYRWASHSWDQRYAPWPLKPAGAIEMNESQRLLALGIGIGVSLLIATVDYWIHTSKRQRQEVELRIPPPNIIIEQKPWDPEKGQEEQKAER
ncbi:MAG: hypothetical protein N2Z76_07940 [Treponemataceae bacterium]|nr:hypothetical protein [Treponemataceae bacterium]